MRKCLNATVILLMLLAVHTVMAADAVRVLEWEDLMPPGEWDRYDQQIIEYFNNLGNEPIAEGSAADQSVQFGTFNVVEGLDGQTVRLPGFVLPFEFAEGRKIREFLLVPYFGACLHTPPPPPNQIVYVTAETPIPFGDIWRPIWAEGTLRTEKNLNGLGDAAYTLHLDRWEDYDEEG